MVARNSKPRRLLALTGLAALLLVACGHPVQRKLKGRWMGQTVESIDDDKIAAATGWARGTAFEFAGDTMTVSVPAEEPRSGKYKVVRAHQRDVYLAVHRKDGNVDKVHLKLDDEANMRWMLKGGRAVVMRRE